MDRSVLRTEVVKALRSLRLICHFGPWSLRSFLKVWSDQGKMWLRTEVDVILMSSIRFTIRLRVGVRIVSFCVKVHINIYIYDICTCTSALYPWPYGYVMAIHTGLTLTLPLTRTISPTLALTLTCNGNLSNWILDSSPMGQFTYCLVISPTGHMPTGQLSK